MKRRPMTGTERQAARRERLKAAGFVSLSVWIPSRYFSVVTFVAESTAMTRDEVVCMAIDQMAHGYSDLELED